jgi:sulfide:quinone oxidoreductase
MYKRLNTEISVAPQLQPSELEAIAAQGFKAIICNRPDGEGVDQPLFAEIERAAASAGLTARYIPVAAGKVTSADAVAFGAAFQVLPKPILVYCRSGTRSATLWALSQAGKRPADDIGADARAAGFDVSGVP